MISYLESSFISFYSMTADNRSKYKFKVRVAPVTAHKEGADFFVYIPDVASRLNT